MDFKICAHQDLRRRDFCLYTSVGLPALHLLLLLACVLY